MGPTRRRRRTYLRLALAGWSPGRVALAFGLVVVLVTVPVRALASASVGVGPGSATIVATVDGPLPGEQFVLDRDGRVVRVAPDGHRTVTAELGHYSTPFAARVGDQAVFGGSRCGGGNGCEQRVAEVVVLDRSGRVDARVTVARSDGWPTLLNGLALVAADSRGIWVNGGGQLHRIAVPSGEVVAQAPWPGGEPCVVDGSLYDLVASGGSYDSPGWTVGGASAAEPYQLDLLQWTGTTWTAVAGGTTTMAAGRNAYCVDGGYEVRDAMATLQRWRPAQGWLSVPAAPAPPVLAPSGPSADGIDHYNLCSAACGPGVRSESRDVVVSLAEQHRPAALSLNEACYDDSVQLAGRLPGLAVGAGYSALDTAVGCPGAVKRFGNVVLVDPALRSGPGWSTQFEAQAHTPCDHRTNECRGMVCMDASAVAYCTAHLESPRRAEGVAAAQAADYVASVGEHDAGAAVRVLAGDFNLDRSEADEILVPAGYRAADGESGQIDLIYDDAGSAARSVVTTTCAEGASDHCHISTAG